VNRVNVNVADIWAEPEFDSERVTQALFNERVEVLKQVGEYSRVRLSDGYEGYLSNNFYGTAEDSRADDTVVSAVIAMAYSKPDARAPIATILPFTSRLNMLNKVDGFALCRTSRYGDVYVPEDDLISHDGTPALKQQTVALFIESVTRFLGVPYLWGGKSFFGFDCSGLIQTNLKFFSMDFPRDTKGQIKMGYEIPRSDIKPGDLLFFERHVALAISATDFIHCSLSQAGVHINSLDSGKNNYLKKLDEGLRAVRRIIED